MNKPHITIPQRPKPSLVEAYNGYYGTLSEYHSLIVRFWKNNSSMYNDASLLCSVFPMHILPSASNGFMNEFHIRSVSECHEYSRVWSVLEFYLRNWKYCEYFIGLDPVYHNECDCYIKNILKISALTDIKIVDPETELKKLRGKWIHEKQLFNIVESLFPNYSVLYHYRAHWLESLELDIYIEDLKIGIEYQGIQHYQVVKHWGGNSGLRQRQFNDSKKKRLCAKYGVFLIYFDYNEPITTIYVKRKITDIMQEKQICPPINIP